MTTPPAYVPIKDSAEKRFADRATVIAMVVIVAGFLARMWAASGTFLNPDEALHFGIANQASLAAVYRASLTESHPPLLYWLLYFVRGLGASELWLRMPSVIAGTAFCWLFFRWLTQVMSRLSGLIGLILVAFLPPVVRLSAEVRQYALLLAFLAGALYFLERALRENSSWLMMSSAVCIYLAMLSHYSALFFVVGMGLYAVLKILWHEPARAPSRSTVAVWVVGQLGAVALLVFFYKTHLSHLGHGESRTVLQGWMSEFYLRRSYFEAGRDNPLLFVLGHSFGVFQFVFGQLAVGDVAGLLFLAGLGLLWRSPAETRNASRQLAFFLALLFALACGASLAHVYPYGGTRHTAYLIIAAVAGVSLATARIAAGCWTRGVALALVLVVISAAFGKQHQPYMTRADQSRERMTEGMTFLRENVAPAGVIFTDFESGLVLGHYLCDAKPISVQDLGSEFERFSCGGYRVVSTKRTTATNFTPEVFLGLERNLAETCGVKPGEPIWIFQAGWGADLPARLRSEIPQFHDLPFRAFGNNIKIFKLTAGHDFAAGISRPSSSAVIAWAASADPQAYSSPGLAL
ncbi:membrane hypothetical protein [Candidatus Sulfotelmatobacter kueseliae]|uniref:Glycosyltransferase RgtA/B/C/D-like domain-containing protein n=1 Tax=Candidatus Sulfotelmatobacter kueseliae TaxID=2042962 RepID=A0A2U3KB63_9BACT|nr:membrane hypothetical protein [Candidatus Sulfotelmatobacter kueseliae]